MKKIIQSVGFAALAAAFVLYFAAEQAARSGVSCSVPNTFINGTTADATQVNANFSSLVACLANAAAAGANSDITSLTGLTTPLSAAQGGTLVFWGGTAAGTNTVTITTVTPSTGFALTSGPIVCWVPGGTNTGAVTINTNGTGATALKRYIQGSAGITLGTLVGGELQVGATIRCAVYGSGSAVLLGEVAYVGEVKDFAGVAGAGGCPTGWTEANGGSFVVGTFPDLNTALGTLWGVAGTLPDLRGTATFGRDSGGSGRITAGGGNFDGTTVGNTQYRQNWTLTLVQLPVFSQTPTWTNGAGTYTPTGTNGSSAFTASNSINGHIPIASTAWANTQNGAGSNGVPQSAGTLADVNGYTPTGTAAAQTWTASNSYTASGTVSAVTFGSGNSHPIIPNAAIVTKCVKL